MNRLRLDRLITIFLFSFLSNKVKTKGCKRIPILMYHSISDEKESSHPYYHINTSPTVFNEHMQLLNNLQYRVINLHEIEHAFHDTSSNKYAVITFDDGFRTFYTSAFPILEKYRVSATVFLPTAFIGDKRLSFKGKECMTWTEVHTLQQKGIHFGSHTHNHPQLTALSAREIESEIEKSKDAIESRLGISVHAFAYPYKFPEQNIAFISTLRDILTRHGFTCSVCTRIGTAAMDDGLHFLQRLPNNSGDDSQFFQAKLSGAYNWLYAIQRAVKRIYANKNQE